MQETLGQTDKIRFIPGMTLRSVCAAIMAMLLMGMHIQIVEVILADGSAVAEQSLPVSAMIVFIGLVVIFGLLRATARFTMLTRQELLCVLFAMLISAPMMTQGMWHRFVGLISAPPRQSNFNFLDAYNDKLWPHGDNLAEGAFAGVKEEDIVLLPEGTDWSTADTAVGYGKLFVRGNPPKWTEIEYEEGRTAVIPVIRNTKSDEVSSITLVFPVKLPEAPVGSGVDSVLEAVGGKFACPGEPYLFSMLIRPEGLNPQSSYFIRTYADAGTARSEVLSGRAPGEVTFIHRKGFLRAGTYASTMPPTARRYVRVEFGLSGIGTLALWDPKVINVSAMEGVYRGRRIVSERDYEEAAIKIRYADDPDKAARLILERRGEEPTPEAIRAVLAFQPSPGDLANLVVKPDNMWSLDGLLFLVKGYIPVGDWLQTAIAWSTPIILLLAGLLAMNVLMRKQWAESQRYPFPLFQIPRAILGEEDEPDKPFANVWRNRFLWFGVAVAVVWGGLRGWHFYNSQVPDLKVLIPLNQYLSDPNWGQMWNVTFTITAVVLSISMFFELNVLISLVIGFFAFRALFWLGESTGMKVIQDYPFRYEQAVGAYLGYALVVVILARKYLWGVLKAAVRGRGPRDEAMSYRTAVIVMLASFAGMALWASWMRISIRPIIIYFAFLVTIGFVASKLRAECGLPTGYFTPYNAMLFITLIGGMSLFGAEGVLFCLIMSGFITVSVFFFIPGAQLELLEYGRRYRVVPRHLVYAVAIGALGGLFIGGWVFLSNAYAIGGENIKFQWAFNQDWFFHSFKSQLARAGSQLTSAEASVGGLPPSTWGYVYGGVIAVVLAVLRQAFSGFWFHPIGFVLGSCHMMEWAWGSVLVAAGIRFVVLKLGGAATVRRKLMPFAAGMFVGAVLVTLIFNCIAVYLRSHGVDRIFGDLI